MATRHLPTTGWFLCALFVTSCYVTGARAQYEIPDMNDLNMTNVLEVFDTLDIQKYIRDFQVNGGLNDLNMTNVLEIFDTLDIQKYIRGLQSNGGLNNIVQLMLSIGTAEYNIKTECIKDFVTTAQGLANFQMWALQMIDAIGKPHSGIISDLDITWLGSYDECVGVEAITFSNLSLQSNPVHQFGGKYCKIGIPMPSALNSLSPIIQAVSKGTIKIGVCIPDSCNTDDMKNIMSFVAHRIFNVSDYDPEAECHDGVPLEAKSIVAICILALFGVAVVIGTLYDIYLRLTEKPDSKYEAKEKPVGQTNGHVNGDVNGDVKVDVFTVNGEQTILDSKPALNNGVMDTKPATNGTVISNGTAGIVQKSNTKQRSTLEKIFLAFSAYTNGLKILNTNQPKGALTCINGIRFFSMTWVILGHSLSFEEKNSIAYFFMKKVKQWTFYGIYSATVSVDTFFTMSGLLVAYLTLREMSRKGGAKKINWPMFYFHRYWRLTPVYMIVLMIDTVLVKHFGDGPKWKDVNSEEINCGKYWWTNLLYINNYYPEIEHTCFGWSWYLANDMQFYVLSPLIIIPLFYNVVAGSVVAGIFMVATTVARAYISKEHEYTALFGGIIGPQPKDQDFMTNMYFPAHTRMGPYIIGLLAGYLLYRYKDSFKMSKMWNFLGWFTCFSIIVLVIYGVYPDDEKHYLSVNESVAYVTLHRTGWGIAVSWIIFACATGYGGWINDFLSWSPFGPLGRMSYCAYLVHLIVLGYYNATLRAPLYLTDLQLIYYYIGNVVLSYMVAFVTSLVLEAPMMALEKVIFRKT